MLLTLLYIFAETIKQNKMKEIRNLHDKAGQLVELIIQAERKKVILWRNYRTWCHFSSKQHLDKCAHEIDTIDRAIARLTESYKKMLNEIMNEL